MTEQQRAALESQRVVNENLSVLRQAVEWRLRQNASPSSGENQAAAGS